MRLKELRKQNKKTQSDIAKILNMSTIGYNNYETGARKPSIETLCKLADYYGVTLDYLLEREENKNPQEKLKELAKQAWKELTELEKSKVYGYIIGIYENKK